MVADPYLALGLDHGASHAEIKIAYRKLAMKFHPDRLICRTDGATTAQDEIHASTDKFAFITAAYAILSDPQRKQQYDHIYKYGGYDDDDLAVDKTSSATSTPTASSASANAPTTSNTVRATPTSSNSRTTSSSSSPSRSNHHHNHTATTNKNNKKKGVGYAFYDPFVFIATQGKVQSKTVAGISIPPRLNMMYNAHSVAAAGLQVSFSSGQIQKTESGSMLLTSKTTQYGAGGKQYHKTERTIVQSDGRKEVVITEGDDCVVERRVSTVVPPKLKSTKPKRKRRPSNDNNTQQQNPQRNRQSYRSSSGFNHHQYHNNSNGRAMSDDDLTTLAGHNDDDQPWYVIAWNGMRDSIQMCTTGGTCGGSGNAAAAAAIRVQ
jgi:curved DNA-binding protein CbpA